MRYSIFALSTFLLITLLILTPIHTTQASGGVFSNFLCNITSFFGFSCEISVEAVAPEPEVPVVTPTPLSKPDEYQIVNSISEVPTPNTTIIEEYNTYTTNPTTVIYQDSGSEISDSEFLDLFHKLTNLIGKTEQQESVVSRNLFDKQIERVFDRSSESLDEVKENNLTSVETELLTVSGNANVGSDLVVGGSITVSVLNVLALSSAGALVAPYYSATSTTATSTFMGAVGIGTANPNNLFQVYDLIDFNNIDFNTKLGYEAGKNIVSGALYNTFLGYQAGYSSSTDSNNEADNNTAIGYQSLYTNTTGFNNTAIGIRTLYSNTTGYNNTAIGIRTLYSNTTGYNNTANGRESLYYNTTGFNNTANGRESLYFNTSGYQNTVSGHQSLYSNTTGNNNTANGFQSLLSNTTGSYNTAIGNDAGRYLINGTSAASTTDYSLFLGYYTKALTADDQNTIVIGYNANGLGSNTVVLGNDSIVTTALKGNVGIGTSTPSSKLSVYGNISSGFGSDSVRIFGIGTDEQFVPGKTAILRFAESLNQISVTYGSPASYTMYHGHLFINNGGEVARIGGSLSSLNSYFNGSVGIGTTTPIAKLTVTQSADSSVGGIWLSTSNNTDFRSQYMNTSGVLSFYGGDTAGTLNTATLNAAGEWTNASDVSYKENIQNLSNGLDIALALKPRTYDIKNTDNHRIGFIAQEVEEIIPEVVSGEDGSKGISYGNLVAVAISAIQELAEKVVKFSTLFKSERIETDTLCIGGTCVTEAELQDLLKNRQVKSAVVDIDNSDTNSSNQTNDSEVKANTTNTEQYITESKNIKDNVREGLDVINILDEEKVNVEVNLEN